MKKIKRAFALFFVLLFLFQIGSFPVVYTLTGGPIQPEVQSFQPADVTEMGDLFTGDFAYTPLFEWPGRVGLRSRDHYKYWFI